MVNRNVLSFASIGLALLPTTAWSAEIDQTAIDTIWVAAAASLVFAMQTGFALLESGLSRAKNSINVLMKNYMDVCVGSIAFYLVGYGLMFGTNPNGWFGTDHFAAGANVPMDYTLLLFQTMFAATAATIASGAMAERTHFPAYMLATVGITAIIYPVFGSWAWGSLYTGEGWLRELGFIDFAGSTVVHSVGGWVALAGVIVLGPRLGRFANDGTPRKLPGHHLGLVAFGGFVLWIGWFGFNGGSTLAADVGIGKINLNTHLSASAGCIGAWVALAVARRPLLLTVSVNGSLGGLVAITAGCATMEPGFAVLTGFVAGLLVVAGEALLERMRIDDVVGAIPVHGLCGAWGTLAAGMFYAGGLFEAERMGIQALGVLSAFLWTFPTALVMFFLIARLIGLRADTLAEQRGLDYSEHAEVGYPEFGAIQLHKGQD